MARFKKYYENVFKPASDKELSVRREEFIDAETKDLNMPEKLIKQLKIISDEIGYYEIRRQSFFNYIFYTWKNRDRIKKQITPGYYIEVMMDSGKISYDLDGSDAMTALRVLEPYVSVITKKELDEYESTNI